VLETSRLFLRQFNEEDAELLLELDSDPEVMRWIGPYALKDADAYRQHIQQRILPYYSERADFGYLAAILKATGDFLGWFHLRPALDYRYAAAAGYRDGDFDLGYRLRRSAWGHGYATEGSRLLIHKAFADWGAGRVVSCALVGNVASTRVMEKCGLKREEAFAIQGIESPLVRCALAANDYRSTFSA
jgi:[ribosomal protein S5]-alanine N-acetyltransferase